MYFQACASPLDPRAKLISPLNMLNIPVAEYQNPMRLACSWGLYHSAVMATKQGLTALSSRPRKKRCT